MHGRVEAREHGRVARARVRHEVAELHRRRALDRHRQLDERLLPENVRVVRPADLEAVLLPELHQLDEAARGWVGQDGDAERECHVVNLRRVRSTQYRPSGQRVPAESFGVRHRIVSSGFRAGLESFRPQASVRGLSAFANVQWPRPRPDWRRPHWTSGQQAVSDTGVGGAGTCGGWESVRAGRAGAPGATRRGAHRSPRTRPRRRSAARTRARRAACRRGSSARRTR